VFGTARLGAHCSNPLGSVIIKDGQIGKGFIQERVSLMRKFALRAAGDRALGATVYVNLEPCNHYGRTPF